MYVVDMLVLMLLQQTNIMLWVWLFAGKQKCVTTFKRMVAWNFHIHGGHAMTRMVTIQKKTL